MIKSKTLTGGQAAIKSLKKEKVKNVFGLIGSATMEMFDALYYEKKIKFIGVRDERTGTHMADGYARASNEPGVILAGQNGPGATNLVTGIATAQMDSVPVVIITGQVGRPFIGTDAFQETDIFGITLPIVKHSYVIRDPFQTSQIISEAFYIAQNGRPGPVLIDIRKDVGL